MTLIETGGTHLSEAYGRGDISVVLQTPPTGDARYLRTSALEGFLEETELGGRVCSLHAVHPSHLEVGRSAVPLRDLRAGWARVLREIEVFSPGTRRILLMGDTNMLRVAVPALGRHGDMGDCHGTLFETGAGQVLVPTFGFEDVGLKHKRPWVDRDVARCLKLTRPLLPLAHGEALDGLEEAEEVVVDLETTGLDPARDAITVLGLQWGPDARALVTSPERIREVLLQLQRSRQSLVFHNAHFDLGFMTEEFRREAYGRVRDTMVRARARGELVASLKHLGNRYTGRPGNYAWVSKKHDFTDPAYVCEDLDVTFRLNNLWRETSPVVELMERAVVMAACQTAKGSAVDAERLDTLADEGAELVARLREELTAEYGVDPGQQELLCDVLRERGYPLSRKTKSGRDALTAEVLEELGLDDVVEFRKAQKLDSAFVGKIRGLIRGDGLLPHRQTMLAAKTGRTSMTAYNHQQSGKKGPTKSLLVSRFEGGLIGSCDLKAAEVRVACYLSGDRKLAAALLRGDIHKENAARGFGIPEDEVSEDARFQAKALIFRSIFGGRPQNPVQERVYTYMRAEFEVLFEWIERQKRLGQRSTKVVDAYGKVINMLDVLDYRGKWACGRLAINGPIQSLASHLAIAITTRTWELFHLEGLRSLVLFGVHDSEVEDVHPHEVEACTRLTRQAFVDLRLTPAWGMLPLMEELPLEGELTFGRSWADTKNGPVITCSTRIDETALPF